MYVFRAVNERFRKPPAIQMTSPEVLSRLEAGNIDGLYVSSGDIDSCFRRSRISREFWERFALDPSLGGRAAQAQHDHLAMLHNATNGILLGGVFGSVWLARKQ